MKNSFPIGGYLKKALRIDLTTKNISEEHIDNKLFQQYIGGTGLGIRILFNETVPKISSYDAQNRIIISTGPLTGTLVPGSGTYSVITRNALTGLVAASQSNGFFGARLKYAGYDILIIQGKSKELVYLYINDGESFIEDATNLAGMGTFSTDLLLRKKYGEKCIDKEISIACIGPAGEKLVRFACLTNDRGHVASTGGIGAIMGSKNLKAIVVRGTKSVPMLLENRKNFFENVLKWRDESKNTEIGKTVNEYGSIGFFSGFQSKGWVPIKNLTTNVLPKSELFKGDYIRNKLYKGVPRACSNCTFKHCHTVQVKRGPYKGIVGEEIEYEILAGFGPNWGIYEPGAATMLNRLNDDLGMDAKEISFLISMIMEGYEKGFISKEKLDGLDMQWGNISAAKKLLKKISKREGIGDILAEGVMRSSENLGGEFPEIAVYVKKGNAPHIHDCRTRWGTLFTQIVSDMGSQEGIDLTGRGSPDIEIINPTTEPDEYLGIVNAKTACWRQFQECLIYCYYQTPKAETMIRTLNSLTGSELKINDALEIGKRVVNLLRMFNKREGATKEHDSFSTRLAMPPIDGPGKGRTIRPNFKRVLSAYYKACGWDKSGMPTSQLLEELDLGFTIPYL